MHNQAEPFQSVYQHSKAKGSYPLAGYAWMSVAISIWASWLVLTSSGVTTDLSPIDLAGLRALVPALVLAPLLWRQRHQIAALGPAKILLLSAYGAPFTLCIGYGLAFATVAHAGAMVPGLMPIVVMVIGAVALRQRISPPQAMSALLIMVGVLAMLIGPTQASEPDTIWIGHTLFLFGAFLWASFAVTMRRHAIEPFLATAIVATISILALAPFWTLSGLSSIATAASSDIVFHFVFQGIITGLVSIYAFGEALHRLGPVATRLTAVTPAVATLLAVPILSQFPYGIEVAAVSFVVAGLLVASVPTRADRKSDPRSNYLS